METRTLLILVVTLAVCVCYTSAVNRITTDGVIIFDDLPDGAGYETETTVQEDGLQIFIEIARSFISAVQRRPVPYTMYRMQSALQAVQYAADELLTRTSLLETELLNVKTDLNDTLTSAACDSDTACTNLRDNIDIDELSPAADFSTIDIDTELDKVNDALVTNVTSLALQARKQFDDLPETVVNKSQDALTDVKTMLADFEVQIKDIAASIEQPMNQVQDQMRIDDQLGNVFYYAEQYSKYLWYIGTCLMGFVLLIVTFYFMGLLCGVCGHEKDEAPTERGCMSNCGGTMLMGGVVFCFIFAPLLMLLTTISFLLGGNLQELLCEPLESQDLVDRIVDYPYILDSNAEYFLGAAVLGDGSIPLTVKRILSGCQNDGAIYDVMMLEYKVNISALVDYRSEFPELENLLSGVNVDMADVVILSDDTRSSLQDFNKTGITGIDFDGYLDEIRKGITKANLVEIADNIDTASAAVGDPTLRSDLQQHASDLRDIQTDHVDGMESYVDTLESKISDLKIEAATLQRDTGVVLETAETADTFIHTVGPVIVHSLLLQYQNLVLGYADQYAKYVLGVVSNDLGGCLPVWNLYKSMNIVICNYVVDSFNCFWFSLGWGLFFFIPSIIFAVKLSKHYRRMEYEEGCLDDTDDGNDRRDTYRMAEIQADGLPYHGGSPVYLLPKLPASPKT
uniref:Prominin-1-A-like n=1 Tax=Saccoglossus kowalevskii TaxID=10224 RepID=A0ABM0MSY7_SACKO|nr:PREDICTED: prominin-1-A-like [Saccoglossus kowalevskii]